MNCVGKPIEIPMEWTTGRSRSVCMCIERVSAKEREYMATAGRSQEFQESFIEIGTKLFPHLDFRMIWTDIFMQRRCSNKMKKEKKNRRNETKQTER